MPTFEEFAQQFDINNPEQYQAMLKQYHRYLDALDAAYCKRWTWCGGCHKTVRFDMATVAIEDHGPRGEQKEITRCPECGTPWFIRDVEVQNGSY